VSLCGRLAVERWATLAELRLAVAACELLPMAGEPADAPLEDRRYSIVGSASFAELRSAVLSAVREKLARRGAVDDDVLEQLIAN
jgi:hypothetical protein